MMAKRTLWNWLFGLMSKPEQSQPMAVPNNPSRAKPMAGTATLTEDQWNELCSGGAQVIINRTSQQQSSDCELRDLAKMQMHDSKRAMTGAELRERGYAQAEGVVNSANSRKWEPGIEHSQPHPVKENPDGTLYYKGKVYRALGERRNNKRRQG